MQHHKEQAASIARDLNALLRDIEILPTSEVWDWLAHTIKDVEQHARDMGATDEELSPEDDDDI